MNVTFDLAGHNYTVDRLVIGGQPGDSGSFTIKDSGGIAVASRPGGSGVGAAPPNLFKATSMSVRGGFPVTAVAPLSSGAVTIDQGGTVVADGTAAKWEADSMLIGDAGGAVGSGSLNVSNKATVTSQITSLGRDGGPDTLRGVGNITVSGSGSSLQSVTLIAGVGGTGNVNVLNTGLLQAGRVVAGSELLSVGNLTVDGDLSGVSADEMVVGDAGHGNLKVQNQGIVQVKNTLSVGDQFTGVGSVTVSGLGSHLVMETLKIGGSGKGTVSVENAGLLSASENGTGRVTVAALSTLRASTGARITARTTLEVNGHLSVDAGSRGVVGDASTLERVGKLVVGPHGTLSGNGVIGAALVLAGGTSAFTGGFVAPGTSPGTLTVEGSFTQEPNAVMDMQIAGTAPSDFDVLAVVGDASIGGDLRLEFLDGFAPHRDDRFDFLTATGALTGQFQHVDVQNLAPGFQFDLRNENGHYELVALNDGVAVPEPAAAALLLALLPLALVRRRRTVAL